MTDRMVRGIFCVGMAIIAGVVVLRSCSSRPDVRGDRPSARRFAFSTMKASAFASAITNGTSREFAKAVDLIAVTHARDAGYLSGQMQRAYLAHKKATAHLPVDVRSTEPGYEYDVARIGSGRPADIESAARDGYERGLKGRDPPRPGMADLINDIPLCLETLHRLGLNLSMEDAAFGMQNVTAHLGVLINRDMEGYRRETARPPTDGDYILPEKMKQNVVEREERLVSRFWDALIGALSNAQFTVSVKMDAVDVSDRAIVLNGEGTARSTATVQRISIPLRFIHWYPATLAPTPTPWDRSLFPRELAAYERVDPPLRDVVHLHERWPKDMSSFFRRTGPWMGLAQPPAYLRRRLVKMSEVEGGDTNQPPQHIHAMLERYPPDMVAAVRSGKTRYVCVMSSSVRLEVEVSRESPGSPKYSVPYDVPMSFAATTAIAMWVENEGVMDAETGAPPPRRPDPPETNEERLERHLRTGRPWVGQ